ncbi:MAG: hypothetical protein KIT34_04935 [Cyanobacteria bacterium TGS_CYA1]|nr:hypothetical protein [Cyanobacteria bacterium TGS_CYA1]
MIGIDEPDLVLFQQELTHALSSEASPEQIIETLEKNPELKSFRNYISTFDVDMVHVANELVHKWGKH